jgi:hypothetical protein
MRHDLADWGTACRQPAGIVVGFEIPHDRSDRSAHLVKSAKRFGEQSGLPRSGAGDQIHDPYAGSGKVRAHLASQLIILLQNFRPHFEDSRPLTH